MVGFVTTVSSSRNWFFLIRNHLLGKNKITILSPGVEAS
jgi:hypothetical protein